MFNQQRITTTKRKGIVHLEQMKSSDFIQMIEHLKTLCPDGIVKKEFDISLKVDGLGFRFGKDANGHPFIESSRSGPVFHSGVFREYTSHRTLNLQSLHRAECYEQLFDFFSTSSLMNVIPNNRKIVCELLYSPLGVERDNKIRFVNVEYDKDKIGSLMTIVPLDVLVASSGEQACDHETILTHLLKESTSRVKIVLCKLQYDPMDLNFIFDKIKTLSLDDDKEIQKVKHQFVRALLTKIHSQDKNVLGNNIEGIVLKIGVFTVKIVSEYFKRQQKENGIK